MATQSKEGKTAPSKAGQNGHSASPPVPAEPRKNAAHPPSGLTNAQKYALLGGAGLLVLILGASLLLSSGNDPKAFTSYLYSNPQSGILMDVRNSPDQNVTTKIFQCGVNLISSGFYAQTGKDLLVFACDSNGCLSGSANSTLNATANSSLMSYSDALYSLRARAYFHILYGAQSHYAFHSTYADVYLNETSDPTCSLGIEQAAGTPAAPINAS